MIKGRQTKTYKRIDSYYRTTFRFPLEERHYLNPKFTCRVKQILYIKQATFIVNYTNEVRFRTTQIHQLYIKSCTQKQTVTRAHTDARFLITTVSVIFTLHSYSNILHSLFTILHVSVYLMFLNITCCDLLFYSLLKFCSISYSLINLNCSYLTLLQIL